MSRPAALQQSIDNLAYHFGFEHQIGGVSEQLAAPLVTRLFVRNNRALEKGVDATLQRIIVLDLHAMRVHEAKRELERLSEAQPDLAVIFHGKGTGKLREVVDDFLQRHPTLGLLARAGAHAERPDPGATLCMSHACLSRLTALYQEQAATPAAATRKPAPAVPARLPAPTPPIRPARAARPAPARARKPQRPRASLDAVWLTGKWLAALIALAIAIPWALNLLLWLYQLLNAP